MDAVHWLKHWPLFADTQSESLELFASAMLARSYRPGEVLFKQGDNSSDVYLITRGETVIHIEQDGRVVATDAVVAGSCVGVRAPPVMKRKRSATSGRSATTRS